LGRMGRRPGRAAAVSRWALGGLSLSELGRRVFRRSREDEILERAAALSYYFVFALIPALLFLTTLLGLLPTPDLMPQLMSYVDQVLPRDAASLLKRTLAEVVTGASGGLLSIGVLAAVLGASSGMLSIMRALNTAYGITDNRTWLRRRLIAFGLTLGFSVFILTAMLMLVFGERIGETIADWFGLDSLSARAWHLLQWPIVAFLGLTGLTLVYYLAPATQRGWCWITPGSTVALVSWLVMSLGLRFYVSRFANYNATYGSIGGVILLMLWLYWSGVALLMGAEIDSAIEGAAAEQGREPNPDMAPLATLRRDA
jgi:membrane protein